jgi:phosphatidylinositol glycan class V
MASLTSLRNVGFLRYWTLPNLPLFLMAAPMLWLLFQSSVTYLRASTQQTPATTPDSLASTKRISKLSDTDTLRLPQLALPQLALAIAAATSFHVQIINRLSSGYPIWYLSVAEWMTSGKVFLGADDTGAKTQAIVRGMILYSIVQGVLYAGFLPPA